MGKSKLRAGLGVLAGLVVAGAVAVAAVALASGQGSASSPSDPGHMACPIYDHQLLTSHGVGADRTLVPAGAGEVMLCRYSGVGLDSVTARRLQAHRRLINRARVMHLAAELNGLRPMVGVYACPADDGTQVIAIFDRYPGTAPDDPVTIDLTGCHTATNGPVVRLGTGQLVSQLTALTPASR